MSSKPRDVLIEIVAKYGDSILTSPVRCEGLLKDFCGESKRETAMLMTCLRSGMVQELRQETPSNIKETCVRLALILENPDISLNLAKWTVESWALALGLIDASFATSPLPNVTLPRKALQSGPLPMKPSPVEPSVRLTSKLPKIEEEAAVVVEQESAPREFLAQPPTSNWGVPDWSQPDRQVTVYPDGSGQKPSLKEAVRDAPANTCLILKPGTYKDGVVIKRDMQIRGDGDPAAIILESTGASVIVLDGACLFVAGVSLKGMPGKEKKAVPAVEVKSGHLAMEYCNLTSESSTILEVKGPRSEVVLSRCHLHDGKAGGIVFQDSAMGYLDECHFYQNKLSHVVIGKGCSPTLLSCKISNALMAGLYVNDGGAGLIENCDIWGNAVAGIQSQRKGNPRVRHCRISLNERYGVHVAERGEGLFEECQISDNARAGVTIGQQSLPTFSKCQIFDNHGEGVDIGDQSLGEFLDCEIFSNENANVLMKDKSVTLFRRCQVHDGHQDGIRLASGSEAMFDSCSIFANAESGLLVTDKTKPNFQKCRFYNGAGNGITIQTGAEGQFSDCSITGNKGKGVVVAEKVQSRFERCEASDNDDGDWEGAALARLRRG